MSWDEERQPLLPQSSYTYDDVHDQFCRLVGVPPSDLPTGKRWRPAERSLYERAIRDRSRQSRTYCMTASVANLLLFAQVIIGAALTGMGAAGSPPIAITLLGASNTIIAGLVAYLKSRGQPMRARMYRDDLERVVDEIENSEIMWLGISKGVNGYDDIDTEDQVTVRSEVARLTRLYDKAVRNNTLNNPDLYGSGESALGSAALRNRNPPAPNAGAQAPVPVAAPAAGNGAETTAPVPDSGAATGGQSSTEQPTPLVADPDDSPATAKPTAPTAVKVVVSGDADKKTDNGTKKSGDDAKKDADKTAPKEDQKEDQKDGKQPDDKITNGEPGSQDKSKDQDTAGGSGVAAGGNAAEPKNQGDAKSADAGTAK